MADAAVLFEFAEEDEASLNEVRALVERLEGEVSGAETESSVGRTIAHALPIHPGAGGLNRRTGRISSRVSEVGHRRGFQYGY